MKNDNWINNFITYDTIREKFIAWDETQAYEIGDGFDTWDQAKECVLEYAKTLNIE